MISRRFLTVLGGGLIPDALEFNGLTSYVDCGAHATIQDIHDGAFTAEAWIYADGLGETNRGIIFNKRDSAAEGWEIRFYAANTLICLVSCATTSGQGRSANLVYGTWNHVCVYWDDAGDRIPYFAIGGTWSTNNTTAGIDAIVSDAGNKLYIGNRSNNDYTWDGKISFARISNNNRYSYPTNFTPPTQGTFPALDANTLAQWNFSDGGGTVLTDAVGNSNGTISNCAWVSI